MVTWGTTSVTIRSPDSSAIADYLVTSPSTTSSAALLAHSGYQHYLSYADWIGATDEYQTK